MITALITRRQATPDHPTPLRHPCNRVAWSSLSTRFNSSIPQRQFHQGRVSATAVCLLVLIACGQHAEAMGGRPPTHSGYFVRVSLVADATSLLLHVPGHFRLVDIGSNEIIHAGRGLHSVAVHARDNGRLQIGELTITAYHGVRVAVDRDGMISVNGQRVRGEINIIHSEQRALRVVNKVDLEDYLASVLVREVPYYWPMEALKAQAIAARTYAMYQVAERTNEEYDVTGDIRSQVYGGRSAERRRTNRAVDATRGQILVYGGDVVPTFFHSTCGGHTESASELWKVDMAPLQARACPFDRASPYYAWEADVSLDKVGHALQRQGIDIGALQSVAATAWTTSGRLRTIRLRGTRDTQEITAKEFRSIIGVSAMKSTLATCTVRDDLLHISGHGWGHGVGMCQWGAFGMADKGYGSQDILNYYYATAQITQLPSRPSMAETRYTQQP